MFVNSPHRFAIRKLPLEMEELSREEIEFARQLISKCRDVYKIEEVQVLSFNLVADAVVAGSIPLLTPSLDR